jgi:hypothetical protein
MHGATPLPPPWRSSPIDVNILAVIGRLPLAPCTAERPLAAAAGAARVHLKSPQTEADYLALFTAIQGSEVFERYSGFTTQGGGGFDGIDDFIEFVEGWAQNMRLKPQKGQARRLVVWCEAAGMVPQLSAVASPFWHPGEQLRGL